jgi:transcriptional regulator with GAF, ATPase, and Fis domain
MVLVNCTTLPSELVESELFGRQRGAYTCAFTSQAGRFELANGSTIFLDEIGELPMGVQAKLLRVLQEGEFQRLGNPRTYKVDARVIAATNRDLAAEVAKGRFREDLFYRLGVFPIDLPPLRDRVEDIPCLAFAFMKEFATRMGKTITRISGQSIEMLQSHSWPGNIRELRNTIERSVILTAGDTLNLTDFKPSRPNGAARLDMEPTPLYSRMPKLAIPDRRQKDASASTPHGTCLDLTQTSDR